MSYAVRCRYAVGSDMACDSVPRRGSNSAAHSGRGGAGNFFQEGAQAPYSNESAADDKSEGLAEGLAAKGKALLFGKKDQHKTESK